MDRSGSQFGEGDAKVREASGHEGRGVVNLFAADSLMASPKLYSSFLLWMLAE